MTINAVSFKQAELEVKNVEKNAVQPKVEIEEGVDTVEISSKKEKPVRSFWGSVGAFYASAGVAILGKITGIPIMSGLKKVGNFTDDESKVVKNAINQMNIDSGLQKKGVLVRFLNPLKDNNIQPSQDENVLVDKIVKFLEKIDRNLFDLNCTKAVRDGENAFFIDKDAKSTTLKLSECIEIYKNEGWKAMRQKMKETQKTYIRANSVILPQKGIEGAGFHELGHAINYNLSKFGKALQKCRPIALLVPGLIATYGAVTRASKPKEEGKELNAGQKTHNFVRDNAGKLAFLASTPMLLEEGMATIKGQKFAKKLLSPELAKKVLKGNAIAYLTYLLLGVSGALAARTAVAVKDKSIAKKEVKRAEKAEKEQEKVEKKEEEIKSLKALDSKLDTYRSNREDERQDGIDEVIGEVKDDIEPVREQPNIGTYRS